MKTSKPASIDDFIDRAKVEQPAPAKAPKGKAGRPMKGNEAKKLKAFNLPLSLIGRIQEEAELTAAGNASAVAVRIFREYFEKKG